MRSKSNEIETIINKINKNAENIEIKDAFKLIRGVSTLFRVEIMEMQKKLDLHDDAAKVREAGSVIAGMKGVAGNPLAMFGGRATVDLNAGTDINVGAQDPVDSNMP